MTQIEIIELFYSVIDKPFLLAFLIILTTFILEDLATTTAALIAAQTDVHILVPLLSLFAGIVIGDIGLYGLGRYANRYKFLQKFIHSENMERASKMLDKNLILAVLGSRFLPGMRLPTYTAIGMFEISFSKFLGVVIIAVTIWTGILFSLFYMLGSAAEEILGMYKWYALTSLIIILIAGPKVYRYLKK